MTVQNRTRIPLLRDAQGRIDCKALDYEAFVRWFVDDFGDNERRAKRVYKGLWQGGAKTFSEIENVTKPTLERLEKVAYIHWLQADVVENSADGTTKWLWKLEDGRIIESVLIPEPDRLTLCMSSQVGCAMACSFCLTGDLGLIRHLKPSEIAGQVMQVGKAIGDRRITNLVLMGMGEPLHNIDNLLPALRICLDDDALGFSHRRVTVSTVGLVHKMAELADALPVNLAVSLNATTEEQRLQIMPVTKKHSMQELLDACRKFPLPRTKRITFEYVMLAGFNDHMDDAQRLLGLLDGIAAKVNLIPYNENPHRALRRPAPDVVKAFQHHLVSNGMNCTVRTTRGIDISAACGQLGRGQGAG